MKKAILSLLLLATGAAHAADAVDPFAPMAFLAGHCWKGDFADGKTTDTHCFKFVLDKKAMVDVHTVRFPGRPDYIGETTYYWDSAAKQLRYLYVENAGGIGRGRVETSKAGLSFPDSEYIAEGATTVLRVQWTRLGDDAYEAWSEVQTKDGWKTMFKMPLKRQEH
jgi:hypothetical protein